MFKGDNVMKKKAIICVDDEKVVLDSLRSQIKRFFRNEYIYEFAESAEEAMDVLDKSGLSISTDVTVRFNPIFTEIGYLYEQFGINYINVLVIPEVRSSVRQVAGRYTAEEIYSTKRAEVEQADRKSVV